LHQILCNLLENALHHTPSGGSITLRAGQADQMLFVEVQDNGEGIAPEHLPLIFERFYRADRSRARSTGGFGLGLAIAKQLVEAQGGLISVSSALHQGATIRFTLPVYMDGKDSATPQPSSAGSFSKETRQPAQDGQARIRA
jgi:signal transduction histidine kinase